VPDLHSFGLFGFTRINDIYRLYASLTSIKIKKLEVIATDGKINLKMDDAESFQVMLSKGHHSHN